MQGAFALIGVRHGAVARADAVCRDLTFHEDRTILLGAATYTCGIQPACETAPMCIREYLAAHTKYFAEDRNRHGPAARTTREIGPLSSRCCWLLELIPTGGPVFQCWTLPIHWACC
jgi:hypothetical protein